MKRSAPLSVAVAITRCVVVAPVAMAADRTISVDCAVGKNAAVKVVLKQGESLTVNGSNCGLAFTEPFIEKLFSKTPLGTGAGPYVWTVSPKATAAVFGKAEAECCASRREAQTTSLVSRSTSSSRGGPRSMCSPRRSLRGGEHGCRVQGES